MTHFRVHFAILFLRITVNYCIFLSRIQVIKSLQWKVSYEKNIINDRPGLVDDRIPFWW